MDLDEFAWYASYRVTGKKPGQIKVLLRSVPYPFLGKDEHGYVIFIPKMSVVKDGVLEYQGILFNYEDKSLRQIVWNLFKSSISYLSLFIAASSPDSYPRFFEGKNEDLALNTISLVEDAAVNAYIRVFQQPLLIDFLYANATSYLLLKPVEQIRDEGLRVSAAVLSYYKTGAIKGNMPEDIAKDVKHISGILDEFEKELTQLYIGNRERLKDGQQPDTQSDTRFKILQKVYDQLSKYDFRTFETPSFPYMNHLGPSSILHSVKSIDWNEIGKVFDEIANRLNLKNYSDVESIEREATKILANWLVSERSKIKVLMKYKLIGEETRFKSFTFPEEDYTEYIHRREEHSRSIRRLVNRLSVVYNLSGEDFRHDTGGLDLQEAIQVVASQSDRNDVFIDESLQYRSQAWAILVDTSRSLKAFSGEVKDVLLCLTEAARKLFQDNHSLGVFAFDDKFYVIKDFLEPYSTQVCARIGGFSHGGMTYLPDGVKMVSEALRGRYEETKIMVVVSDGFPSGYTNISEDTSNQIKRAVKSGIHMIGIGINSEEVKEYFPVSCTARTPYDLMKSFANVYLQYAFSS